MCNPNIDQSRAMIILRPRCVNPCHNDALIVVLSKEHPNLVRACVRLANSSAHSQNAGHMGTGCRISEPQTYVTRVVHPVCMAGAGN